MAAYNPIVTSTAINRIGNIATFVSSNHGLRNGANVLIQGVVPSDLNGSFTISTSAAVTNVFSYTTATSGNVSASTQGTAQIFNMDDFTDANPNAADTLTIDRGAVLTCNSNQRHVFSSVTGTQGVLNIVNTSTVSGNRFYMGRYTGTLDAAITMNSALFTLNVSGDWIILGTGTNTQQDLLSPFPIAISLSGNDFYDWIPAVFVETASGSNTYDKWFNATINYGQAWPYFREGIQNIIADSQKGKYFEQLAYNESTIPISAAIGAHFKNVLRFGEYANRIPLGAKVRIPNILLTSATPINLSTEGGTLRNTVAAGNSGNLYHNKCIFGEWLLASPSPANAIFNDCVFTYPLQIGTCLNLQVNNCAIHAGKQRVWYDQTVSPNLWKTVDLRNRAITVSSVPNSKWNNNATLSALTLTNSPNSTISDHITNMAMRTGVRSSVSLDQSPGTTITNLKQYNAKLTIAGNSNTVVDGLQVSYGNYNEVVGTGTSLSSQSINTPRIGYIPGTMTRFENNTPYYFKVRSFNSYYDNNWYIDNPITYSATPYQGRMDAIDNSDVTPYFFGAALTAVTSGAWQTNLTWNNISGTLPFTKVQIFRSTTLGVTGSQIGADIVSTATVNYNDFPVANNTTYYYTLRYFRSATAYTDTAQQIVTVPNFSPTGANWPLSSNWAVQSGNLTLSPWVAYGTPPTLTTNILRDPLSNLSAQSTNFANTRVVFAAGTVGGRQQPITVISGAPYNIHMEIAGDDAYGTNVVLFASSGSTSGSLNCPVSRKWQKYNLVFTPTTNTMNIGLVSDATSLGKTVYVRFNVSPGTWEVPYLNTTTTSLSGASSITPFVELSTSTASRITVMSKGDRKLIEIGNNAPANSLWHEVYCDSNPSFTPSLSSMCYSSMVQPSNGNVHFNGVADNVTIKNVTSYGLNGLINDGTGTSFLGIVTLTAGFQTNVILKDWNVSAGFSINNILNTYSSAYFDTLTMHNINVYNSKGFVSNIANTPLTCNNVTLQNIYLDDATATNYSAAPSNLFIKGSTYNWSGVRDDTVNAVLYNATAGITVPAAQFDTIFYDGFTQNITSGFMGLQFTPTQKTTDLPYVIDGSNIRFDNAGKLYFGSANESITYTFPYRIFGQTGWADVSNIPGLSAMLYDIRGTDLGNNSATCFGLLVEYSISSDGYNYGAFKEMTYANTSTEIINPTLGFYLKVRLTPKNFFKFSTKISNFNVGETVYNAALSASPIASAVIRRIETDPTTSTAGTLWVDTISGSWTYNTNIYADNVLRATMAGSSSFGAVYPFIQSSYIDGLTWYMNADRTKKYPVKTPLVILTNTVSGSNFSIYDATTGEWKESNVYTTDNTAIIKAPWNDNYSAKLKLRRPGYQHFETIQTIGANGLTYPATLTPWTHISSATTSANILLIDHRNNPITWNSKQFRFTIQPQDGSNADVVAQWFYNITALDTVAISGYKGNSISAMIVEDGNYYKTQLANIDGTLISDGGVRVIDLSGNALSGFTKMQANDGTYWTPPINTGITFTNLIIGSQVVIYQTGTQNVIARTDNSSTSFTYSTLYSSDQTVDYTIINPGYLPQRVVGLVLSSSIQSVPISQISDRVYSASTGLTSGNITINSSTKRITVSANTTVVNLYGYLMESWKNNLSLGNVLFPFLTNGVTSISFAYDWELYDNSNILYLSGSGIRYLSSSGATTSIWSAFQSLGNDDGATPKFQQTNGSGTQNCKQSGPVNELIHVYGDASHGNFDERSWIVFKSLPNTYLEASYDVITEGGITQLSDNLYVFPLANVSTSIASGNPGISGVTIIDHGASPVTWNGKNYSITIQDVSGNSATNIFRWLNWYKGQSGIFQGKDSFNWPQLVQPDGTNFQTVYGKVYGDVGASLKGVRAVDISGNSLPGFSKMQADDGSYYYPPQYLLAQVTGIISGSRLRVYNTTTATEIVNSVINDTSWTLSYLNGTSFSPGDQVDIRLTYQNGTTAYIPLKIIAISTSSGWSVLASQTIDTIFNSIAIDGSTVTEFTTDYPHIQIDINDGDGITSVQRIYAWMQYIQFTSSGITNWFGAMTAVDSVNFEINVNVLDLKLDNTSASPVMIVGGRLYRSDGTTVIASSSGSIQMDPDKVYAISTGGSALTPAQDATLQKVNSIDKLSKLIPAAVK